MCDSWAIGTVHELVFEKSKIKIARSRRKNSFFGSPAVRAGSISCDATTLIFSLPSTASRFSFPITSAS
ncbi:unnamed protein product [Ectocarpus sp. CCAP 1310/34]|nr:unnamed protein product [Ectocarpus sp. CCAP 1310/34]